jgi:hypothetical protein
MDVNKWTIHIEGGGLCATAEDCEKRSTTDLGSSKNWRADFDGLAIFSSNKLLNPDFYEWNHVFIPYCSGDLWSGTVTKPSPTTFNFYFSGHLNLAAVLDYLTENHELGSASNVILSGASAGGIGTFNNIDFVTKKLSWARVDGNPWAGWYFPQVQTYYEWQHHLPINYSCKDLYMLYSSYVNEDCAQDHKDDPWYCGPLHVDQVYSYVKTPLYVAENMFDSNQLYGALGCPRENTTETNMYMLYDGMKMRESIEMVLKSPKKDGLYMPSCLSHVGTPYEFNASPRINGVNFAESLGDWYFKRGKVSTQLMDSCHTVQCNPKCPSTPT